MRLLDDRFSDISFFQFLFVSFYFLGRKSVFDDFCRIPTYNGVWWYIFGYNCSRCNYSTSTYSNTFQYGHITTHPYTIFYMNIFIIFR